MIASLVHRLRARTPPSGGVALAAAVGLVTTAGLMRLALQPVFGGYYPYTVFYPAVILAAFLAGGRAGALATVLSALAGYWVFQEPVLQFKASAAAIAPLAFFAVNGAVATCLIGALHGALAHIAGERQRAEAAARQNADLFRELNERVGHHLQLVSAVLALQAEGEPQRQVADALAKASETSLLLARAHRDVSGQASAAVDFMRFARHLVGAKLASHGLPAGAVELSGERLELPADQATSLGVALLECLSIFLGRREPRGLHLEFRRSGPDIVLRMAHPDAPGGAHVIRLADGYLLRAAMEQLDATLSIALGEGDGALEILFRKPERLVPRTLGAVTLH